MRNKHKTKTTFPSNIFRLPLLPKLSSLQTLLPPSLKWRKGWEMWVCDQSMSLNLYCSFFLTLFFPGFSLGSFTQETCVVQFSVAWSSQTAPAWAFSLGCHPSGTDFFRVRFLSQLRTDKDKEILPFIFYNPMFNLAGN